MACLIFLMDGYLRHLFLVTLVPPRYESEPQYHSDIPDTLDTIGISMLTPVMFPGLMRLTV